MTLPVYLNELQSHLNKQNTGIKLIAIADGQIQIQSSLALSPTTVLHIQTLVHKAKRDHFHTIANRLLSPFASLEITLLGVVQLKSSRKLDDLIETSLCRRLRTHAPYCYSGQPRFDVGQRWHLYKVYRAHRVFQYWTLYLESVLQAPCIDRIDEDRILLLNEGYEIRVSPQSDQLRFSIRYPEGRWRPLHFAMHDSKHTDLTKDSTKLQRIAQGMSGASGCIFVHKNGLVRCVRSHNAERRLLTVLRKEPARNALERWRESLWKPYGAMVARTYNEATAKLAEMNMTA